jgi:hypothetical protein
VGRRLKEHDLAAGYDLLAAGCPVDFSLDGLVDRSGMSMLLCTPADPAVVADRGPAEEPHSWIGSPVFFVR